MATLKAAKPVEFDVVLTKAGDKKIMVIRVLRELTKLGLNEAKALVDGAPKVLKANVTKAVADLLKKKLEETGAVVRVMPSQEDLGRTEVVKTAKPVDRVGYEPAMIALSEARAAVFAVRIATDDDTSFPFLDGSDEAHIEQHLAWLRTHALDWLRDSHDDIEAAYRKCRAGAPPLGLDGAIEKDGA